MKSLDTLYSLLYSAGDPNFRDTTGALAADPNAQRLPDGVLIRALYRNAVSAIPALSARADSSIPRQTTLPP